jgi:hypothetical protein
MMPAPGPGHPAAAGRPVKAIGSVPPTSAVA